LSSTKNSQNKRLRVFAGPNGSGKSTIIKSIRNYKTEHGKIDFGIYINADDINVQILNKGLALQPYEINTSKEEFIDVALKSGLIGANFTEKSFKVSFEIKNQKIILLTKSKSEQLAQIIADFLRKKLLAAGKKFSFETVFSHPSKLDIMREAKANGYKVYLYFVSTSSPEINKERVALRVKKGGHNVPIKKIEDRYYRSLNLLYDAAQLTYQTYFFDNSGKDKEPNMFTYFKIADGKKQWKKIKPEDAPDWFIEYYADKVKSR
jgi:predicted ABC-type ATPase